MSWERRINNEEPGGKDYEVAMENLQFDWNNENIRHLALHKITRAEAEQVIQNRPVDLGTELRNGEERIAQVGETDTGKILIVVTAMRDKMVRVVTAWPAKERLRRYFQTQKRNGNVGRIEEQDLRE
jgi:uncharacterized DUF497 family protein